MPGNIHRRIPVIRSYFEKRAARRLRALLILGENSEISGFVDKRAKGASIIVGNDCLIEGALVAETDQSQIQIGNNVYVGGQSTIDCVRSIVIEDDVLISYHCIIADSDNHSVLLSIRKKDLANWKQQHEHDWSTTPTAPVRICHGAWIG